MHRHHATSASLPSKENSNLSSLPTPPQMFHQAYVKNNPSMPPAPPPTQHPQHVNLNHIQKQLGRAGVEYDTSLQHFIFNSKDVKPSFTQIAPSLPHHNCFRNHTSTTQQPPPSIHHGSSRRDSICSMSRSISLHANHRLAEATPPPRGRI